MHPCHLRLEQVLIYGCESWAIRKQAKKSIERLEM